MYRRHLFAVTGWAVSMGLYIGRGECGLYLPTQQNGLILFKRNLQRTGPTPDPSGNTGTMKSVLSALNSLNMDLYLSDTDGKTITDYSVHIKPVKLAYLKNDVSTAKSLYCIFEFTFPAIPSAGLGYPSIVTSKATLSPITAIGSDYPYASGTIDIYDNTAWAPGVKWRYEETAGVISYYDYDDLFTQEKRAIQFPEHIMKAVLYEIFPNNTYRYNMDGLARMFDYITAGPPTGIPNNIKPFDVSSNVSDLNRIFTITPRYAGNKQVKIYHMARLDTMPNII